MRRTDMKLCRTEPADQDSFSLPVGQISLSDAADRGRHDNDDGDGDGGGGGLPDEQNQSDER